MATTAQSVAQAATAAADSQQQQQQQQNNAIKLELDGVSSVAQPATAAVAPAQPAPATSPTGTQQMCKWSNPVCRELFQTPEDLYQHLTEQHVGRKSNNNLNLTCRWEQCNTTVIKRDHITSHLRVHVALKPHTCPKCQKSFKRPQDLKKHIKTHADDSGNGQPGGIHGGPAYSSQGGSNYYPAGMNSNSINFSFPQQSGGFHTGYPPSGGQMNHSFGANSAYWTPQASSGPQATSFSLGGLLGAQRAHAFDPHNYGSFRPQLDGYEAMQHAHYGGMPIGGGGDVAVAAPYQSPHELAQSIRTKNDLTQVHAMLKEMHQAALNHQPQHQIFPPPGSIEDYGRGSGSPPGSYRTDSVSSSYSNYNRSTTSPTPSLTPGSSVHSYQHSPAHDHVLPSTQPPVSYPSLPGATTGPVNGLGSHYDGGYRHNYRPLGKAQGQQDSKDGDADSTLDPALRGLGAAAAAADKENSDEPQRDGSATPTPESPRVIADRERETAQRQAAMLESWMEAVQKRLDVGDYEEEDDEQEDSSDHEMVDADGPIQDAPKDSTSTNPSYPDLPMPEY